MGFRSTRLEAKIRRKRLALARKQPGLIEFLQYSQIEETGKPLSIRQRLLFPRARRSLSSGRPSSRRARRSSSGSGSDDPEEPEPALAGLLAEPLTTRRWFCACSPKLTPRRPGCWASSCNHRRMIS